MVTTKQRARDAAAESGAAERCVHELFEVQAARSPDAVALVYDDACLTYGELNARANRLAHHLRALGVVPDTRVAVCMERSLELVIGLLAVLKAGGAYVPLDPSYPLDRLAYMLADSAPVAVLTHARVTDPVRDMLRGSGARPLDLDADGARWNDAPAHDLARAGLQPRHLAYAIYTSGSTGSPKGVMVEHAALANVLGWMQAAFALGADDVGLQKTPFSFDASAREIFPPLLVGARLVIARPDGHRDPAYLADIVRRHGVTVLHFVPSMLQMFLEHAAECASVRLVACGGEELPSALVRDARETLPAARLYNVYGPTETTVDVTAWQCEGDVPARVPIGCPMANTTAHVLDARGEPVPAGVAGTLHIGGAQVARGYLGRPSLTAERFVPDPFASEPGARMYDTGDLARCLPDGAFEYLGRNDFQVKLRGFRVELGEIEARLRAHEAVRDAVVLAREDEPGEKRLVAYHIARAGDMVGAESLRAHVAAELPEHMVPAAYVALDAFPLTPNGKLDRAALPAPGPSAHAERAYEAPLGPTETALARIWSDVLGLERIGRQDNFFELGGHSLLAVRVLSRMRKAGIHANIPTLFTSPTLAALAQAVGDESGSVRVPPNRIPPAATAITPEMLPLVQLSPADVERVVATVDGGAPNVQDIYPLAPLQEGLLFHHLLGGEGDPYLVHVVHRFDGRARLDRFLAALQAVIDRHDIMRTAVVWEGLPEPVQVVWRRARLQVSEVPVAASAGDVVDELVAQVDPRRYRLDIRRAPLLRALIAREPGTERWVMVFLSHHLVHDNTSRKALYNEIQAFLSGADEHLPAPLPFRNLVAQARLGISREEHERFFRAMLGDVAEPTAPFGLTDVRRDGSATAEAWQPVEARLGERLRERAALLGVSVASICHLAWAHVLARLSGRDDVVFGTVLFGRMQGGDDAEHALGLFLNTLPVRLRLDRAGVEESVRRTHALLAELLRHEHASLALAQRCSALAAPAPLFSSLLNCRHSRSSYHDDENERALEGVEVLRVGERTNYPVTLSFDDFGDEFSLTAQVDASLDPARICAFVHVALERLVDALERAPAAPLPPFELLSDAERRRVLVEWNATETPYAADRCVHQMFEEQVRANPGASALVHDGEQLTYGELNERANRLARHLCGLGVGPDARVALCLERSTEMVVAVLAVLKAGGAYVPLDPAYPLERLAYMLADSVPVLVLTHGAVPPEVRRHLHAAAPVVLDLETDARRWADLPAGDLNRAGLGPRDLAYVMYTSGSTGSPKGAMVEHRGACNLAAAQARSTRIEARSRVFQFASFSFDVSVFDFVLALCHGAELHVPPHETLLVGQALADAIAAAGITHVVLTTAVLAALPPELDLPSVTTLVTGGEAVTESVAKRWAPGRLLLNMYGPTECTVAATFHDIEAGRDGSPPIGRPIANARAYILDERGDPVPVGVVGELYIGGAGIGRGFFNRPALTAERFVPDPFGDGERLYKSGDLARHLPDGTIEFVGRNDFQVKLRGFRIELGEIEARLEQHPAIREAVVLARADGAAEKRLVAYYTSAAEIGAPELRAHVAEALPDHMVPAAFVQLDALPLTPNGKVDRARLPAPDAAAYSAHAYEPPAGPTEIALAQIWCDVLGLERIGRQDNFFELGGHSLSAVRVLSRMRGAGMHADIARLFLSPTLAALAEAVGDESQPVPVPPNRIPPGAAAIEPEMLPLVRLSAADVARVVATVRGGVPNVQDIYPLAPLQEGLLFHHLLASGDPYVVHVVHRFADRTRLERFLDALQAVIDRHDILRTAVVWEGLPEPVQVVWREARLEVEEVALDPRAGDAVEQLVARVDPRHYRIDIQRAPLLRAVVARDAVAERWVMVLLSHHLVNDNTSQSVLYHEIQAHLEGRAERLAPPLPFRNLVAQARLGTSRAEDEAFFTAMLGDVDEPTAPFGLTDVRGDGAGTAQASLPLDPALAKRLRARAAALGVSVASICHLAWAVVLARVSGRDDVVFGTVLFGRMHGADGAERALGLFLNTLPVRVRLGGASTAESVRRTHALLAQLLRHEHASLALAQRCSALAAPAPLFSSLLNCRHSRAAGANDEHALEGVELLHGGGRTNYPITLAVDDLGDGFSLTAQVDATLDPGLVCGYMHAALDQLVGALEREPDALVGRFDLLSAAEHERLVNDWNATATSAPAERCVHELFEARAREHPHALALAHAGGRLSYGELNARANRLARHLRARGVRPGTRVGLCLERGADMLVALLAVLKAGGAYLPLDPAYPLERLAYMFSDGAPLLVLTHAEVPAAVRRQFHSADALVVDLGADAACWADLPDGDLARDGLTLADLAYVMYTSGSTGNPKGVMVEHRGIANLVLAQDQAIPIGPADRVLQFSSFSFDVSVFDYTLALCHGASLHVPPRETVLVGQALADAIAAARATHVALTPAVLAALPAEIELPSVRVLMPIGEALGEAVAERWAPGRLLLNMYGPTECSVAATFHACRPGEGTPPIGRPIANTRAHILDAHGELVPTGVVGELHLGGAGVARGYLNRPALTAERFVPSPFGPGERLYRTGDLVRQRADGTIEFLGRNDFQVKIRGFRIELGEIEARLARHEEIAEAVVLARADGPGEKRLVAYYTPRAGAAPSVPELRAHVAETLPEYMVPAAYVPLAGLPLTANGKLDRKSLPAPETAAYAARAYEEPSGPAETALADAWREVLGLERIGRHDDFFELGGHSLSAVRVLARVREELGAPLGLAQMFAHPVLSELARVATGADGTAGTPSAKYVTNLRPPVPAARTICFLPTLLGIGTHYRAIARELETVANVRTCRLRGVAAGETPQRRIEDIAAHCLEQLVPDGRVEDVALVGWSFGGALAFEMARQLAARGRRVGRVVLIDAYAARRVERNDARAEFERLVLPLHEAYDEATLFALYEANAEAVRRYQGGPYDGAVDEIRAHDSNAALAAPGSLLRPYQAAQRRVVVLPGDHFSIVSPANAAALAAALDTVL